ncbi:transcription factor IBH1-like [Cynara cardunculus var. scolymus]|uniref:transcription factor IBH1-like n=1 Tax=Cynara cardunculus var. scolymus TaxID=59895 RepID=UPI000D628C95|nr:transcription factor IBH1-like [Cynara cardunculus var. scolymus]
MSASEQQTTINPTSLKIQLAYRFHHALKNLNNGRNTPLINNTKASAFENTQIRRRSHRVKIAAYTSMASVAGSRRAWSRAILWKIRSRARNKKMVIDHKTSRRHPHRVGFIRRRNTNPKREYVDPIGDSGLEVKLRKLVPGAETMDSYGLLDETADYIKCLATQVEVMRTLLDLYSTF